MRFIYSLYLCFLGISLLAQDFTNLPNVNLVLKQLYQEQRLIKQNQNLPELKKATLLIHYGLMQEAKVLIDKNTKNTFDSQFALALFHLKTSQYNKALKHVKKALEIEVDNRKALMLQSKIYLGLGHIELAIQTAENRLANVDFDDRAIVKLAEANLHKGDSSLAKRYTDRAISYNKNNADAWYLSAMLQEANQKKLEAHLVKCLNLNPYHIEARIWLANHLYQNQTDNSAALMHCKIALTKSPFEPKAHRLVLKINENLNMPARLATVKNHEEEIEVHENLIKEQRQKLNLGNVNDQFFIYAENIENSKLSNSLLHACYLELIYTAKALDQLKFKNLGALSNSKKLSVAKRDILKTTLKNYPNVFELLQISELMPIISVIKIDKTTIPFYQILEAITNPNKLIPQLIQTIHIHQMPLTQQRAYRKSENECNLSKIQFKERLFYYLENRGKENCETLKDYFKLLLETLQTQNIEYSTFKAEAFLTKALKQIHLNKWEEAENSIKSAFNASPQYFGNFLTESLLWAAKGNSEQAELNWQKAKEIVPNEPQLFVTNAKTNLLLFENGKISVEKALQIIEDAYKKAIEMEVDPLLLSEHKNELLKLLKLFGEYNQVDKRSTDFFNQSINEEYLAEMEANLLATKITLGFGNKSISKANKLLNRESDKFKIAKILWTAYKHTNQDTIIIEKLDTSLKLNEYFSLELSPSNINNLPTQLADYELQQYLLLKIEKKVKEEKLEEAENLIKNFSFSKLPEIWSNYHYTRSKLLMAKGNNLEASNALLTSLNTMPFNVKSLKALKNLAEMSNEKIIRKNYKKGKKVANKIDMTIGPDL